jgi:hypothetical protein
MIHDHAFQRRLRLCGSTFSDVLGGLWYLLFGALTIWGIGWSFYRHGPADGVASVLIPPYAWYRGVAAIWEEPKWKRDYDTRTEQMAIVIENSVSNDPGYQVQSREFIQELKSWLKTVPTGRRAQLREAARNYSLAMTEYCQRYFSAVVGGANSPRPELEPTVQQRVDRFSSISGFTKNWKRFVQDSAALKDIIPTGEENNSDLRENSSITVGQRAVAQNRLRTYLDAMTAKMDSTIDDLFAL